MVQCMTKADHMLPCTQEQKHSRHNQLGQGGIVMLQHNMLLQHCRQWKGVRWSLQGSSSRFFFFFVNRESGTERLCRFLELRRSATH